MNVTTRIGERRDFVLTAALLIYEDQIHKREQFATVHEVIRQGPPSEHPRIGPGRLLTTGFLHRLCCGLQRTAKAVLLPENVLAYTADLLIWWTAPRLHSMFFSEGAEDRTEVNGKICPHPPLLWKVHRGSLYLRALSESHRPLAESQLMVAPYWNTQVSNGTVCAGSMSRPAETNLENIVEWEEGFFNSRFTHPSGVGKLTKHQGGFMGLWMELAAQEQFPPKYLAPAGETLRQFVEAT